MPRQLLAAALREGGCGGRRVVALLLDEVVGGLGFFDGAGENGLCLGDPAVLNGGTVEFECVVDEH